MLRVLQLDELEQLLLDASGILRGYEARQGGFEAAAASWLERVEAALLANRLPLASRVAATRAGLAAVRRTKRVSPDSPQTGQMRRADRDALTVDAIRRTLDDVYAEIAPSRARVTDAAVMARHVLAVARHKGVLPDVEPADAQGWHLLVQRLEADSDVGAGVVQLHALVGQQDTMIMLSRGMAEVVTVGLADTA